jgi:hypothetical protein
MAMRTITLRFPLNRWRWWRMSYTLFVLRVLESLIPCNSAREESVIAKRLAAAYFPLNYLSIEEPAK